MPTAALNNADVWRAMLPGMPIMALVRNLGKMSSLNIFDSNLRDETIMVVNKLGNKEVIEKSRIHPMQLYIASKVYSAGRGVKGSLSWRPNAKIRSALRITSYNVCYTKLLRFDLIVHSGDIGSNSQKSTYAGLKSLRRAFPDHVILTVKGNHDWWDWYSFKSKKKNPYKTRYTFDSYNFV